MDIHDLAAKRRIGLFNIDALVNVLLLTHGVGGTGIGGFHGRQDFVNVRANNVWRGLTTDEVKKMKSLGFVSGTDQPEEVV